MHCSSAVPKSQMLLLLLLMMMMMVVLRCLLSRNWPRLVLMQGAAR